MRDRRAGSDSASRLLWVAGAMISVLFIVAVSYAFYGDRGAENHASSQSSDTLAVRAEQEKTAQTDSDGDGLPDWEELLWGTDPNNSDTDGNGIPDARSSDSPEGVRLASEHGLTEVFGESDNVTTVAARELFGTYILELAAENTSLTPEEQSRVVEQALTSSREAFKPPTISIADLHVVPASSDARAQYVTDMKVVLNEWLQGAEQDYELMKNLTTDDRAVAVEGLARSVEHYDRVIERLRQISVPEDASTNHRAMVSALMGYSFMVASIRDMERDPVRATAAVQLIVQYDQAVASTVRTFGVYSGSSSATP